MMGELLQLGATIYLVGYIFFLCNVIRVLSGMCDNEVEERFYRDHKQGPPMPGVLVGLMTLIVPLTWPWIVLKKYL